ncbi:uncharacterized protein L969DRAFT_95918 [Mixia osmundae IAM 14324]|uniref:Uncharacterized protein n=1 Tax=Mixia osmundae (strain CBS 9802 / IAM 14324 / JCM 22182 / KY 12970) TaxID=764103 RepID=G7DX15_MIXOS|nr:uncharacterized protein L969DRAFT_95918 [Mixia osmundae IAM 14324]KEI38079.1 hypothetical protein L969DRAFT_95918 [Mixia osmundae IAM 14324]GAA95112.1 hypothetical protein E5Q_01767 [Mixia osmundae IAM 14324]
MEERVSTKSIYDSALLARSVFVDTVTQKQVRTASEKVFGKGSSKLDHPGLEKLRSDLTRQILSRRHAVSLAIHARVQKQRKELAAQDDTQALPHPKARPVISDDTLDHQSKRARIDDDGAYGQGERLTFDEIMTRLENELEMTLADIEQLDARLKKRRKRVSKALDTLEAT